MTFYSIGNIIFKQTFKNNKIYQSYQKKQMLFFFSHILAIPICIPYLCNRLNT